MDEIEVGKVYIFQHQSNANDTTNGAQVLITEEVNSVGRSYRGHLVDNPEAVGVFFANELTPLDGDDDGGADYGTAPEVESYTVHPVWNLRVVALQAAAQTFQGEGVRTSTYVIDRAEDFLAWLQQEQA